MSSCILVSALLAATFQLAGTCAARTIDVQAVVVDVERVKTAGVHEGRKVVVPHLLDLATGGANQVGVGQCDALILGLHAFKHMAPQHLGLDEQFDGIINRRAAHAETVHVDQLLQFLDGEVPVGVHDAVQYGIALGGPAHAMLVQIVTELADNGVVAIGEFFDIWNGFHRCDKSTTFFAIEQRICCF